MDALSWIIFLESGLYDQATVKHAYPSLIEGKVCESEYHGHKVAVKVGKDLRVRYYKDNKRMALDKLLVVLGD